VASAERYRTNKRKGRDKEAARIVTGGEATKSERRPEQMKDTAKRNRQGEDGDLTGENALGSLLTAKDRPS
jgi:hypothetical protein